MVTTKIYMEALGFIIVLVKIKINSSSKQLKSQFRVAVQGCCRWNSGTSGYSWKLAIEDKLIHHPKNTLLMLCKALDRKMLLCCLSIFESFFIAHHM